MECWECCVAEMSREDVREDEKNVEESAQVSRVEPYKANVGGSGVSTEGLKSRGIKKVGRKFGRGRKKRAGGRRRRTGTD